MFTMKSVLSIAACVAVASAYSPEPVFQTFTTPAAPDCTFRPTATVTATTGCPTTCATVEQCYVDSKFYHVSTP